MWSNARYLSAAVFFLFALFVRGAAGSETSDCPRDQSLLAEGRELFEGRQFLLSGILFSQVAAGACNEEWRNQGRWSWALSLYELGDLEASRRQFEKLRQPWSLRAQRALWILNLNVKEGVAAESIAVRDLGADFTVKKEFWKNRRDRQAWTTLSKESQKLDLAGAGAVAIRSADLQTFSPRDPWIAGTLSGVLPGAGQVYAGAYQSAAVSFVLNFLFLSSTLELAKRDLPSSAWASGVVWSVVYVGNILNAAESARKANENFWSPRDRELRTALFPELKP